MRPAGAAFDEAVRASHRLVVEATVISPAGFETAVELVDGSVTLDQTAAVRGRCDVTLADDGTLGLVPTGSSSLLSVYGAEIRLARGVIYAGGSTETVTLGVFRIQEVDVADGPDGMTVRLAGLDRAQRVADARFEDAYTVAASTNYADAILAVVQSRYPEVAYDFAVTGLTTPTLVANEGDDPWAFAQQMAAACAMRLYFDGDGTLVLVPIVLSAPVATVAEGEGGVLLQASRTWTREGSYNRVIATGENTGEAAPARGVATDDNPLSPTYYFGPFGRVPRFYSSSFITTDDQAAAAAAAMLGDQLGTSEKVSFGSLVLPQLEPGDTVRITRARSGIDEDHVIDALTIPLGPDGAMSGQTRAREIFT